MTHAHTKREYSRDKALLYYWDTYVWFWIAYKNDFARYSHAVIGSFNRLKESSNTTTSNVAVEVHSSCMLWCRRGADLQNLASGYFFPLCVYLSNLNMLFVGQTEKRDAKIDCFFRLVACSPQKIHVCKCCFVRSKSESPSRFIWGSLLIFSPLFLCLSLSLSLSFALMEVCSSPLSRWLYSEVAVHWVFP